jgi:hypothetical protein
MKLCPSPSSSLRPLPTRQHNLFRHRRVSAAAPVRKVLSIATERKSRFLFFFVSPRCSLAVSGSSPPSSTSTSSSSPRTLSRNLYGKPTKKDPRLWWQGRRKQGEAPSGSGQGRRQGQREEGDGDAARPASESCLSLSLSLSLSAADLRALGRLPDFGAYRRRGAANICDGVGEQAEVRRAIREKREETDR